MDGVTSKALVVSLSDLRKDPRVTREIDWLASEGWTVDSLGLGSKPTSTMRDHFEMARLAKWANSLVGKGLIHSFLPYAKRFNLLIESRIPREVSDRVRRGEYDLVLFNDLYFMPWISNKATFSPQRNTRAHLDLHEFHPPELAAGSSWRFLVNGYYRWQRRFVGSPRFRSRSVVANGIADLYAEEFGVPKPTVIRNAPPYTEQPPSPVNPDRIELLFHGTAAWPRGLNQLIEAVRQLDARFALTFMLTGPQDIVAELRTMVEDLGDRVTFAAPVAMGDVTSAINAYDLEVMFYPPTTDNLRFALPNKLFEAVQGRLGIVIGASPMMAEIIEQYSNGIIADGWEAKDLATALNGLTPSHVVAMKAASALAAQELNAEREKESFLRSIQSQ